MVETRQHCCLAQKLIAGLIANIFRKGAVVLDFLQRALAALQSGVVGEIDRAHSALTDPLSNFIAAAQYLPVLKRWEQCFSFGYSTMVMFLTALCRRKFCTET